jgi:P27 family predicted phage terminase small subunit
MRGRKPVPTHLKLVTGNPGKRAINRNEPRLESALPTAPEHLSAAAKAKWAALAPELHQSGLLTRVDGDMLAVYCSAWADLAGLELQLHRYGMMLRGKDGTPYPNPYFYMRNKAANIVHKFGIELGMSPSSRSRVTVGVEPAKEDPAHKYIG